MVTTELEVQLSYLRSLEGQVKNQVFFFLRVASAVLHFGLSLRQVWNIELYIASKVRKTRLFFEAFQNLKRKTNRVKFMNTPCYKS